MPHVRLKSKKWSRHLFCSQTWRDARAKQSFIERAFCEGTSRLTNTNIQKYIDTRNIEKQPTWNSKKKKKIWVKCMDTIKFTNKQQLFLCCIRISTRCDVLHVACSNVACCCYKIETICRRFPILYLSWNNALTGFNMMRIRYSSSTRFIHRQFWFFPVLLGYNGRISVSLAINLLWMIFIS